MIKAYFFSSENAGEETSSFLACKHTDKHRAEGFQRAIGKPFGRARRREPLCVCKNVLHHLQKCKMLCQRYEAIKAHQKRLEGFSVSGDNMDSGPGRILGIQ